MRAALRSRGNIYFESNYRKPKCGANDILVRVKGAAINPVDYKLRWPIAGPVVGIDVAGVVEEKGPGAGENINVGDEVYGFTSNGSLAEFTVVHSQAIALKPKNISFVEAAAMNITYMTSLQALRDYGKLQPGGRILIIGASGGCGTAAIQLAKSIGAKDIIAVCSGKNEDFVRSLGATEVIDYTKQTVNDYCTGKAGVVDDEKRFDMIFDAATNSGAGEDYKDISMELLKEETPDSKHGQYVAINGSLGMWLRAFTIGCKANQHLILTNKCSADLEHLAKLVDEGWKNSEGEQETLKPVIAEELPLSADGVEKGFSLLKSRRVRGKIVYKIDE